MYVQDDYQTLIEICLENNPQYRPAEGEPLNGDVDFYIWNEVVNGKGPNGCFFAGENLAAGLRVGDRNLFQRLRDGEGGSRQPNLSQDQLETVRQVAASEVRREMEAQMTTMRQEQEQQLEIMRKRQSDMEEHMRRFMQGGGNQNVPDTQPDNDGLDDFDLGNYPGEDAP